MRRLATEVAQDRAALEDIMGALGIPVRGYKVCAAWIGERAARLKLNGYLLARSRLSGLEELERLRLGGEGKAAGWCRARYSNDRVHAAATEVGYPLVCSRRSSSSSVR